MRIEVYTEVNRGDPNAFADRMVMPEGKGYGMGKADYQPTIQRCEYTLDAAAREKLLEQKLTYLPYFREKKPAITLADYFAAQDSTEKMRPLLPFSLEQYLKHPAKDRASFDTIIEPESTAVRSIAVVWLDDKHWYVDQAFYSIATSSLPRTDHVPCKTLMDGTLAEFMRDSPIVAKARTEGSSLLQHPKSGMFFPFDSPAIELSKSPGGPGSTSWQLTVLRDGAYVFGSDLKKPAGFDPHRLTQLRIAARKARLTSLQSRPAAFAHDRSETTLRMTIDDKLVQEQLSGDSDPALTNFVSQVKRAYGLKD